MKLTRLKYSRELIGPRDLRPVPEEADVRARYTPVITSWVEAIRTDDADLFFSLFTPAVSDDDMSLEDAKEILGEVSNISLLFVEFQKYLYEIKTA